MSVLAGVLTATVPTAQIKLLHHLLPSQYREKQMVIVEIQLLQLLQVHLQEKQELLTQQLKVEQLPHHLQEKQVLLVPPLKLEQYQVHSLALNKQ